MAGRFIFLLFLLISFNPVFALVESSYLGFYHLKMEGLSRFGSDNIELSKLGDQSVEGTVGIDWSVGPEARTPQEWEIFYKIPFQATIIHDGNAFHFQVTIAKKSTYDFTLFPVQDEGDEELLVGYVKVTGTQAKGSKNGRVFGVIAEKISED